jgi:hypothetical protein
MGQDMTDQSAIKLTKGQRACLKAIAAQAGGSFHRRVVQPLFDAGLIFPAFGNVTFFIVGCNGHGANNFTLTVAGAAVIERLPA